MLLDLNKEYEETEAISFSQEIVSLLAYVPGQKDLW